MRTLSYTIILATITVIYLVQFSHQCYCRQGRHVMDNQKRCECCVYMLHGKRSDIHQHDDYKSPSYQVNQNTNLEHNEQRHILWELLQQLDRTIPEGHHDITPVWQILFSNDYKSSSLQK